MSKYRAMGEKCRLCDNCTYDNDEEEYFCNRLDSYVEDDCWCEDFSNHMSDYLGIDLLSMEDDYENLCYQDGWN